MWKLKVNVVRIKTDAGEFYWQIKSSNMLLIISSNRVATASKKTSWRTGRKGSKTSNSHLQLDIVLCCRYNTYVGLLISLNTFPRTQSKRTSQMCLIHSSPKYSPTFTTSITNWPQKRWVTLYANWSGTPSPTDIYMIQMFIIQWMIWSYSISLCYIHILYVCMYALCTLKIDWWKTLLGYWSCRGCGYILKFNIMMFCR